MLVGKNNPLYNNKTRIDTIKNLIYILVKHGANIDDINDKNNKTAYDYANDNNNDPLAHYILLKKAIILASKNKDEIKETERRDKIMDILTKLPKERWFDQDVFDKNTILICLADKGNYELVKYILDETSKPPPEKNNNTNEDYVPVPDISAKVKLENKNGESALKRAGLSRLIDNKQTLPIIDDLLKKGKYEFDPNDSTFGHIKDLLDLAKNNHNRDLADFIENKINERKIIDKEEREEIEREREKLRYKKMPFLQKRVADVNKFSNDLFKNNPNKPKAGKRTAKKSRKMRKRKSRKTRRVR
jgi:ankyrin repeat protein